jgi:hypothetical protein
MLAALQHLLFLVRNIVIVLGQTLSLDCIVFIVEKRITIVKYQIIPIILFGLDDVVVIEDKGIFF